MQKRKTLIVDIDGTIADLEHRLHHIGKGPGARDVETSDESREVDWDAFHEDCHLDNPIEPTCELIRSLGDTWCIIMITGRGGENAERTKQWLEDHDIPYDLLLMREPGDHSPDVEIKESWLNMIRLGMIALPQAELPSAVIEDRTRTIAMWRENGLIAYQCDTGEF